MVNLGKAGRDMDYLKRYLIEEEIEEYQENHISRREMIRRVLIITGSVPTTASILLAAGCGASPTATTAAPTAAATVAASAAPSAAPATVGRTATAGGTATAARTATTAAPPAATATRTVGGAATATRTAGAAGTATRTGTAAATATRNPVTVQPTDPAIDAAPVQFPGQGGITLLGYLSSPKAATKAPGILVIHENRGLTEHIKDMTRRYATSGFVALAIDLISRQGGTDRIADPAQIPNILGQAADREALVQDMLSAVGFLKGQAKFAGPKAGVVGYCFGGGMTWLLATRSTDIGAANPYYGPPPDPISAVQNIAGPVLAFYGENDPRINANIPNIEAAMRQYNKPFEYRVYPRAGHAFNNDTGANYQEEAATDAYRRSVEFFTTNLRS
jgi:carboxymethylenebutenolidase